MQAIIIISLLGILLEFLFYQGGAREEPNLISDLRRYAHALALLFDLLCWLCCLVTLVALLKHLSPNISALGAVVQGDCAGGGGMLIELAVSGLVGYITPLLLPFILSVWTGLCERSGVINPIPDLGTL